MGTSSESSFRVERSAEAQRLAVAADLGFAETVFVDDPERAEMRIFAPEVEMPFAGHPSVGTAWLLREEAGEVAVLRPPAGDLRRALRGGDRVGCRAGGVVAAVRIPRASERRRRRCADGAPGGEGWAYCWAWEDEEAGRIRARSFVAEAGIAEDEATGSAALALCAQLGRPIQIRQGRGL